MLASTKLKAPINVGSPFNVEGRIRADGKPADFQRAHYSERDWARSIVAQCSEPAEAFHNWMERDIRFAEWMEEEAKVLHLPLLRIDGNRTLKENAEAVATHFQFVGRKSQQ